MKRKILVMIALMLVVTMSLSSCGLIDRVKDFFQTYFGQEIELTDAPLDAGMLIDFAEGANPDVLFESDGWSNGDVFNVVWKSHNVHYEDGIMRLGITEEQASAWIDGAEVPYSYTAGEARTQNYYHYGDYEVSMKPSANGGTASTFFVCTGPYDLKDGVPNAHDEIDIEFLGKDTTHVQFNFFVDGVGENEYMYDLGFDASEEFHTYGFRWEENAITWFVDGEPVYKVTTDDVEEGKNLRHVDKLPSTAGRILTNYWCGNERAWGWMGEYKGETADNGTTYQWIKTSAEGAPLNPVQPPVGGDDPNPPEQGEAVRLDVEFKTDHADYYTIEAPEQYCDSARITYAGVIGGKWSNVNTWLDGKIGGYDTLMFKIKNDGEAEVNIFLQLQNAGANIAEQQLSIPAGEEKAFEVSYSGNVQIALFFIDSSHVVTEGEIYSGDITISEIKVAKKGADEPVDPQPPVDLPDGEYLEFKADPVYTLHNEEQYVNSIRVTYDNVSTDTYQNVNAWIKDKAAGKAEWTVTIRNDGAEQVYVTLKLETENKVGLKEEKMYINPGETLTLNSTFEGEAAFIYFFIDSGWTGAEPTTHAGDVTISNIAFSGEAAPDDGGDDPKPEEPVVEYTDLYVEYKTENAYTLVSPDQWANQVRVTYTDIAQGSWANINIWVEDKSADCSVFSFKLTNHGEATVSVWVQMKDAVGAELINQNVDIEAGAEKVVTFKYTGTAQMIFFFVDSTHEADAELNTGDITISELKLGKVASAE